MYERRDHMKIQMLVLNGNKAPISHKVFIPENRITVRGIYMEGYDILLGKYYHREYTIPGGGVEPHETLEEALYREILEETGYNIRDYEFIGTVFDQRMDYSIDDRIYSNTNYIFSISIDKRKKYPLQLDEDEIEREFIAEFVDIRKAIETNQKVIDDETIKKDAYIYRSTLILREILAQMEK